MNWILIFVTLSGQPTAILEEPKTAYASEDVCKEQGARDVALLAKFGAGGDKTFVCIVDPRGAQN